MGAIIGATVWMARKVMRWYHLSGSVYYSGRFWFHVGRRERTKRRSGGGGIPTALGLCRVIIWYVPRSVELSPREAVADVRPGF